MNLHLDRILSDAPPNERAIAKLPVEFSAPQFRKAYGPKYSSPTLRNAVRSGRITITHKGRNRWDVSKYRKQAGL